ncbi:MAG: hypothetical protein J0H80_20445 [Rhizobiales bacterium]|nr:hypothetical protein [Hyphomicrobiales bacterium]
MMNAGPLGDEIPLIDSLRSAPCDRARAEWLSVVPLHYASLAGRDIAAALDAAGFAEGHAYLVALLVRQQSKRLADGRYPLTVELAVEVARADMWEAVRKGEVSDARTE